MLDSLPTDPMRKDQQGYSISASGFIYHRLAESLGELRPHLYQTHTMHYPNSRTDNRTEHDESSATAGIEQEERSYEPTQQVDERYQSEYRA
jgi:hypothetical protein